MKKFTILFVLLFAFAGMAKSQSIIEDFEHIKLNLMLGDEQDNSSMTVVANPDPGEENPGHYVAEFYRSQHGVPWGGFFSALPEPIDLTEKKYIHVKVWKPRVSPTKLKIEGGPDGAVFEIDPMEPQQLTEQWEHLVYHFDEADGEFTTLVFLPDFEDPVDLDEDIIIYFDDFILSDNPVLGEGDEEVIESFDFIHMNLMVGDEDDDSRLTIVPNPDQGDDNPNNHVVKFERSQHGVAWGGFWAPLQEAIDLTETKYIHVKVWKPRVSPVKFKIEGGPDGAVFEIDPVEPQSLTGQWETLSFHFDEATGEFATIVFMPDFEDPLELDEDIVIYFDDIWIGHALDEPVEPEYDVDFTWSDFDTEDLTNVEGFREPINENTVATDMEGEGPSGGTALKLEYEVTETDGFTGYKMYAYPDADVSAYSHLVLHIKADEAVTNAEIGLFDTQGVDPGDDGISYQPINIGTDWEHIILPVDEFELPEGIDNHPDLSILQLIQLVFDFENVEPKTGTVYIDVVGFNEDDDLSAPGQLLGETPDINVFPNPANRQVHIETPSNSTIALIDVTGNVILQTRATGETTTFNLEGLANGIYLVRVIDGQNIKTVKLLVH